MYNKNSAEAPKPLKAKVESSNGEVLSTDNHEANDGLLEDFFDMFTGDIDHFDYSFEGSDTKNGSWLQGNIEDADLSIDISIDKDVLTFTTTIFNQYC